MDTFPGTIFWLAVFVNLLIFVSSLDDAFIDVYFWIRHLYRRLVIRRRYPRLRLESLALREEAPFALMVPAWREFEVIAKMIENTNATLAYQDFRIFVGTYPNDGETQAEVDRMARRYRNVRRVDVPHDGPTCKADCLNAIVQEVFREEDRTGRPFAGIVIHDSEDVIHPLELKVFNHLVDRKDLIQLPVLSLERKWHEWVAGTYQDDFAEWHSKDLVVRESLTGLVPCAGTGMCYSRRALVALCEDTCQAPFNTATLTEDYDFSFRLSRHDMKQVFVKIPLRYSVRAGTPGASLEREDLLGVREFFPSTFRAAYRQRARWILGIGLQGWETLGWKGDLKAKYFMFRDRKGLFTSLINMLAYLLLGAIGGMALLGGGAGEASALPEGFAPDGWLAGLAQVNAGFMANRVLQRFLFVRRLYGFTHGVLSIPRILVSNLVNFFAASRAWGQYLVHRITGRSLTWDKTAHAYPTGSQMQPFRRRLGDILLQWNELDQPRLDHALAAQRATGRRLGHILVEHCGLSEAHLADAIAFQSNLPRSLLNMAALEQTQTLLPRALALPNGWIPLGVGEQEELLLGVSSPPSEEAYAEALRHLRIPPRFFILTESEAACGLAYLVLGGASSATLDPAAATQLARLLDMKAAPSLELVRTALADYSYPEHGSLPVFLASRNLPGASLPARLPGSGLEMCPATAQSL